MVVKTFRGLLAHDGQDQIRLSTIKGKVAYRIVKFQIIPENPFAAADKELVVKIYKTVQTAQDGVIDFSDPTLLGAAVYSDSDGSGTNYMQFTDVVIFDGEIFNQDIYVTYVDKHGTQSANYYIELEVIPLDDAGAQYTTLKDLRSA